MNYMRIFIYYVLVNLVCIYYYLPSAASSNYQVGVNGIRVVGQGYSSDPIRPFHREKGLSIGLSVIVPAGGIVKFDEENCNIDKISDDKGNNLIIHTKGLNSTRFGFTPQISNDRKCVFFEIESPVIPSKGSEYIDVSGSISLYTAYKKKTYKLDNVILAKGEKINIGPISYIISELNPSSYGAYPIQVTFQTTQKDNSIDEIKFYDISGEKIKSVLSAIGQSGNQYDFKNERTYELSKSIYNVRIAITYWTDMKRCSIPFEIKATVGL